LIRRTASGFVMVAIIRAVCVNVNRTGPIPTSGFIRNARLSFSDGPFCRNTTTDAGWPPLEACIVPGADVEFTLADPAQKRATPAPSRGFRVLALQPL